MSKKKQTWYSIRARANARSAEVMIYGDIGESWDGETVTARQFVKDVTALDVDTLTIRINSFGGSVADGLAIYNAITRHKARTVVAIDGVAASIASLIAMAGDSVEMAENALLMIHAPWGVALGNSADLRDLADQLDVWAGAMATSYAAKTGRPHDEMLALLTDGQDHWFSADEAIAGQFVDSVTAALPIAASAQFDLSRFKSLPASISAGVTTTPKESSMPVQNANPGAAEAPAPVAAPAPNAQAAPDAAAIAAQALAADTTRRNDIRAAFAKFVSGEGVSDLQAACEADTACTVADARSKLLAHLGKDSSSVAGRIVIGESEPEKFRAAASEAIMARSALRDDKGSAIRISAGNQFRSHRLVDIARACLERAGRSTGAMSAMDIVAAAFTQSTSDFPVLLENVMHKTLQQSYAIAPDTWSRWCAVGSVSDFRAHNRYRIGSFGNLSTVNELGEFTNKSIPDGEKATITATTKGNIINISRQAVINDDLGAFVGLAAQLGRAAKRTIEADAYALLVANPKIESDNTDLFHANHHNFVTSGGAPTVTTVDVGRQAMAAQMDISGNDYLDIRPSVWLGPLALGGAARVVNDSQYDPDASNKLQRPNICRGLLRDVVDTPRLTGTAWYLLADPMDAPVFEVAFLDGQQEPFLELQNGFDVDGARYKVRLDYGIACVDYRGAFQNDGA